MDPSKLVGRRVIFIRGAYPHHRKGKLGVIGKVFTGGHGTVLYELASVSNEEPKITRIWPALRDEFRFLTPIEELAYAGIDHYGQAAKAVGTTTNLRRS